MNHEKGIEEEEEEEEEEERSGVGRLGGEGRGAWNQLKMA
jgi:hypothetical protein